MVLVIKMINQKIARSVHLLCLIISRSQITQKNQISASAAHSRLLTQGCQQQNILSLLAWWEIGCKENRHSWMCVLIAVDVGLLTQLVQGSRTCCTELTGEAVLTKDWSFEARRCLGSQVWSRGHLCSGGETKAQSVSTHLGLFRSLRHWNAVLQHYKHCQGQEWGKKWPHISNKTPSLNCDGNSPSDLLP